MDATMDGWMDATNTISGARDSLIASFNVHLLEQQPRGDYRELLEQSVTVLGGVPARSIEFKHPGAISHARWVAKVIYALKVYPFRN